MTVDRRPPRRPPALWALADIDIKTAMRKLERWLRLEGNARYDGLPAPHSRTHLPEGSDPLIHGDEHLPGGGDPITTAAPSGVQFDDSPAEGEAESLTRSDHVHNKPTAEQVLSSIKQKSLKEDILWLSSRELWARVYASRSFR